MPIQAMAFLNVRALAQQTEAQSELTSLCETAGVDRAALLAEVGSSPDLFAQVMESDGSADPHPATTATAAQLRKSAGFRELVADKMSLGADAAMEMGNLYTAALPAWLAAGMEEAAARGIELAGETLLAIAYGSGDAAEALPLVVAPGWRAMAEKIAFSRALEGPRDLAQRDYESLHDRGVLDGDYRPSGLFFISRVGDRYEASFQDLGVEYYDYAP
jgi:hydroxymethylglutaryl-CoA synthase